MTSYLFVPGNTSSNDTSSSSYSDCSSPLSEPDDMVDVLYPSVSHPFHLRIPNRPASRSEVKHIDVKEGPRRLILKLNVSSFKPEELQVKIVNEFIVIQGKHNEYADEQGFVTRSFTRKYPLPDDVEPSGFQSYTNPDGVLVVEAPKKHPKNELLITINKRSNTHEHMHMHHPCPLMAGLPYGAYVMPVMPPDNSHCEYMHHKASGVVRHEVEIREKDDESPKGSGAASPTPE